MAGVDIDSFVNKFKSLWSAGHNATLNIESKLGEVEISLRCKIGRSSPPPSTPFSSFGLSPKYRSPSYYRRQARRKDRRKLNDSAEEDHFIPLADQVSESRSSQEDNIVDDSESLKLAEKASGNVEVSENNGKSSEEVVHNSIEDSTEEVEKDELARDKIIEEILVYAVVGGVGTVEKKDVVEQEIVHKLADIGVTVESMQTFSTHDGKFDQSRVRTTPVNLKSIWGRRLGLKKCAVIEYRSPPSCR